MPYRAAVIGCGKIGSAFAGNRQGVGVYTHAEAYSVCPDTDLVAVCDRDPGNLHRCGDRWNVACRYGAVSDLMREQRPEIVSVCTPDETHYEIASAVLRSPAVRAIFMEKPIAIRLDEAKEIVQMARERHVLIAVNYSRRYAPSHRQVKEYVTSGRLGRVQAISGFYSNGVIHSGTHWFDLARFLFGEVVSVRGIDTLKEHDEDPTLDTFLEFASGNCAYLHANGGEALSVFEMDIIGTKGRIRMVESGHVFEHYEVRGSPYYEEYRSLVRTKGLRGGLEDVTLHAVQNIVQSLNNATKPFCTGEDAVAALEIALLVCESAQKGNGLLVKSTR